MLVNDEKWIKRTLKKFVSFSEKSPLLLGYKICELNNQQGIFVTSFGSSELSQFFPFDSNIDSKEFIHQIKEYFQNKINSVILRETIKEQNATSIKDVALYLEKGYKIEDIPQYTEYEVNKYWVIDRVILWKNIFILKESDETGKIINEKGFRFKFDGCAVLFLKDLREGKYKSPKESGEFFFNHSLLINQL